MIEYKRAQDLQISVVDNEIIRGYMKRIQQGESIDPVQVLGVRVKDGNHRAAAYRLLGLDVPTVPYELPRQTESLFKTPEQQAKYEAAKKEIRASIQPILDELDASTRLTAEDYSIVINER